MKARGIVNVADNPQLRYQLQSILEQTGAASVTVTLDASGKLVGTIYDEEPHNNLTLKGSHKEINDARKTVKEIDEYFGPLRVTLPRQ